MGEPSDSAISSLAELLRYPDDLAKVPAIKERLIRDKAAIELQIKSGLQTQLDTTLNGTRNLLDAKALVASLGEELQHLNILCAEADNLVPGFQQINRVSRVRRNFLAVEDVIRNLKELPSQLDEIEAMIEEDGKDIFGPMTNFLTIHFRLSRLRDFQDQTMAQAAKAGPAQQHTLSKHFARLNSVVQEFEAILFDIAQNLLEVLREGNASLIVRWAKIIDIDERLDTKVKILNSASDSQKELAAHLSMNGSNALLTSRTLRNYDDKLTEYIKLGAQDVFRNCVTAFPNDPTTLLDNLYWIMRDILAAKVDLTTCVPESWKITERFVAAYHQETYVLFKSLLTQDTEAGLLLKIVRWSQKYNDTMTNELKIPKSQLTPPLLDGQEHEILGDYMRLICRKLDEWMQTVARSEFTEFRERKKAPESDPEMKYGLENTPIVFQMLNQQINVSIDSAEIRVVSGVIHECKRQLINRQEQWLSTLREEIQKSNASPEDVPGGVLEYSIAVANDQIRGADYTENIIERQINTNVDVLVHSDGDRDLQSRMVQELEDAMDGFIATSKSCITELVGMVMYDIQPSLAGLFKQGWYSPPVQTTAPDGSMATEPGSVIIQEVINTFEDYSIELQDHLNPDLFSIYIDDLLDATLAGYLGAIQTKGSTLSERSIEQIKSDVALLYPFFTAFTDSEYVEAQFASIEILMALITADKFEAVEEFRRLKESFPDSSLKFVEDVLRAREDLDSRATKEYLEAVRSACMDLIINTGDQPTYFSRLYN
ncbi:exocyst complex component Sec6-domain-containing protein [Myxozyma melibiosi]|uniref:Exocyst complex component Sec6-domain-containing protein n=1 Tax=Myxozyma melibiosi TaxID=54550 RepID=A0ABR1FCF4_9ASCO